MLNFIVWKVSINIFSPYPFVIPYPFGKTSMGSVPLRMELRISHELNNSSGCGIAV